MTGSKGFPYREMSGPTKLDVINYIKSMKIEIKSLSARINYLTRYVVQQRHQLSSALKKIASLEQSSKHSLNRSIGVSHSPQSKRSVGCQIFPGTNPLVSVSPDVNEVSSNSESFEDLHKSLQPPDSINLPICCNKPQKRSSPLAQSPSSSNESVVLPKKKKRRSLIIPTQLRKIKKITQSPHSCPKTPEQNINSPKKRHRRRSQRHLVK
ncbi:unnamed protein product [Schistosoma bovis]|nr:unnamed protein product [Schistosoma bovis]